MVRFNAAHTYEEKERTKTIITQKNVFLTVVEKPNTSIREMYREQEISYGSAKIILANSKMRQYQLHNELADDDFRQRITFFERKVYDQKGFLTMYFHWKCQQII